MAKTQDIIPEADVIRVHGYADFGSMTPRQVIDDGVRKYAIGYSSGHTQMTILLEHGLISKPRGYRDTPRLTKKGMRYARAMYPSGLPLPTPPKEGEA